MPSVDYKELYEESQLDLKRLSGYAEMVCKAHAETKEDLIDFSKMKQERVFELEKELEELKKEFEEVKKERDIFKGLHKITRCKKVGFMNMKASKDFDKLKEENKELKEENDELKMEIKGLNKELEYEADTSFTELTEEIEELREKLNTVDEKEEENKKLKEKNEELKETIDCYNAEFTYLGDAGNIQDYRDFNKFLKNEYSKEEYQKIYDNLCLYDYVESDWSEDEELNFDNLRCDYTTDEDGEVCMIVREE